jgi:peptide/nickel transport system substrate-binding protein
MEIPAIEMLPTIEADKELKLEILNKFGFQTGARMNFLHPPFDNVKVRRAALLAVNQKDVLDALIGNPKYYKACAAIFICDTPFATDIGGETLAKGGDIAAARKALAESGYDGTPVVLMAPGDVLTLKAQPIVVAQQLREAGFKVDLQATDWQTVVSRRASQKPPKEGGWNMFITNWVSADVVNPISNVAVGGQGKKGGWFGWAEDAKVEQLKDAFVRAASLDDQKKIATEIQKEAYDQVLYMPLGQYQAPSAWRKSLSGVIDGPATPVFWNIDKTE